MTTSLQARRKKALQPTATVVEILLHHGVAGLVRHGNVALFLEATNIIPKPVPMPPLAQELLDAELSRALETQVAERHYDPDAYVQHGNTSWSHWKAVERVGRILACNRGAYYPFKSLVPILLFVNNLPQTTLDTYHSYLAQMIDTGEPRARRKLADELLSFILPAGVGYLTQAEIIYLYTRLVAWQVRGR